MKGKMLDGHLLQILESHKVVIKFSVGHRAILPVSPSYAVTISPFPSFYPKKVILPHSLVYRLGLSSRRMSLQMPL